jgi:uracil phosphoribosyltransferase
MHQGFLDVFDQADNAFVAAYRREGLGTSVSVALEYVGSPDLEGRVLFFCDPMLATASSMLASLKAIERHGKPRETHVAAVFASAAGVEALHRARPDVHLWVGVVDPELNSKAYIVPGLGDAGDLAFGEKL